MPESLTPLAATMVPEVQQQSRRLHVVHRRWRGPRPDEVQEPAEILVHSGRKDPPSATRVPGTQLRPACLLLPPFRPRDAISATQSPVAVPTVAQQRKRMWQTLFLLQIALLSGLRRPATQLASSCVIICCQFGATFVAWAL